jgi:hypothetical protein
MHLHGEWTSIEAGMSHYILWHSKLYFDVDFSVFVADMPCDYMGHFDENWSYDGMDLHAE